MELHVKNNGLRCRLSILILQIHRVMGSIKPTIAGHILGMFAVSIWLYRKTNTYIYIHIVKFKNMVSYLPHMSTCRVKEPKVYHNDRFISLDSDPFLPSPNPLLLGMIGCVGQNSARMRCQDVVGNLILSCWLLSRNRGYFHNVHIYIYITHTVYMSSPVGVLAKPKQGYPRQLTKYYLGWSSSWLRALDRRSSMALPSFKPTGSIGSLWLWFSSTPW